MKKQQEMRGELVGEKTTDMRKTEIILGMEMKKTEEN